jgi:hypothetical protein
LMWLIDMWRQDDTGLQDIADLSQCDGTEVPR